MELIENFRPAKLCFPSNILKKTLGDARASLLNAFQKFPMSAWQEPLYGPSPLWLLGHFAYYQEEYFLRPLGELVLPPRNEYDYYKNSLASIKKMNAIDFDQTWGHLKSLHQCIDAYLDAKEADGRDSLYVLGIVAFTDRLAEVLATYLHHFGYASPVEAAAVVAQSNFGGAPKGDIEVPGGHFSLGVTREMAAENFYHDNEISDEKVLIKPFSIAKAAVTNAEFLEFVAASGYLRTDFWSYEGKKWLAEKKIKAPHHFEQVDGIWYEKFFNEIFKLRENNPICHISWFEAEAFCNWAKRRLPTEMEWEMAASTSFSKDRSHLVKSKFPWGNTPLKRGHANLSWSNKGTLPVGHYPRSDSAWGAAQMLGNTWEWTASTFYPYGGFKRDVLDSNYSLLKFGRCKVAKGGSFATRGRLMGSTYRQGFRPSHFYGFTGFRTCEKTDA